MTTTYCFISDIHVQDPCDDASTLLRSFLNNSLVEQSQNIIFLGDIFDHLIGEKAQYLEKFDFFFKSIVKMLDSGKKIVFLEGNHDFHFQKTFTNYIRKKTKNSSNFTYLKDGAYLELGENKFYFCHGDEVDFHNESFKKWKKIYRSTWFQFLVNYILPYSFVAYLGDKASRDSKKRGRKTFDFLEAKNKYIHGAKELLEEKDARGIVCGHTHIQESHRFDNGAEYFNCGFPLKDKDFLYFNGDKFELVSLS